LEHRASNPVSVKNLTAIETSTIVKLLRPRGLEEEEEEEVMEINKTHKSCTVFNHS
jgi:hypothetical protein